MTTDEVKVRVDDVLARPAAELMFQVFFDEIRAFSSARRPRISSPER